MLYQEKACIAISDKPLFIYPSMANRHGLIAGATGTGKTVTMRVIAESFSDMGVPVFMADVKGDLNGLCQTGGSEKILERAEKLGIRGFKGKAYPVEFWDIFGEKGHPVRVTVSDLGPAMLSRLLNLTEIQQGVLNIVFKVADEQGLLLLDLKDLRALLKFVGDNRAEFTTLYGNVSSASIGAIQRALLAFESEGGEGLFGEPALSIKDWIRTDDKGRGVINILAADRLIGSPTVYSTFLLWLLTELFEQLPEVGDLPKPRMVFFFDEAHLLFNGASKALVQKIVQVVKLIRSKGVGVYFISQSPSDLPGDVLAQLQNRVQHGLHAYTPQEQKAVRAAAKAFRVNPDLDTEAALQSLGTGEALISFLDEEGIPSIVEKAMILPPQSDLGTVDESKIQKLINASEFELKYRDTVDRESAYEIICAAEEQMNQAVEEEVVEEKPAKKEKEKKEISSKKKTAGSKVKKEVTNTAKKAVNSATSSVARSVSTNMVNSVLGGKKTDGKTIAKRAATNALSSVMRSGASAIVRGIFGNKK